MLNGEQNIIFCELRSGANVRRKSLFNGRYGFRSHIPEVTSGCNIDKPVHIVQLYSSGNTVVAKTIR